MPFLELLLRLCLPLRGSIFKKVPFLCKIAADSHSPRGFVTVGSLSGRSPEHPDLTSGIGPAWNTHSSMHHLCRWVIFLESLVHLGEGSMPVAFRTRWEGPGRKSSVIECNKITGKPSRIDSLKYSSFQFRDEKHETWRGNGLEELLIH